MPLSYSELILANDNVGDEFVGGISCNMVITGHIMASLLSLYSFSKINTLQTCGY